MNKILELWNSYCIGETNIIYERYIFNNRNQDLNESIDTYASALVPWPPLVILVN